MRPSTRGLVVLTAAVVLWSCSGDPTEPGASRIVAKPSALFLNQGQSAFVTVQLVDEQGGQQEADFAPSGGTGLTVTKDPDFLPAPGGQLRTSARFIVVANQAGGTSFTVTAQDTSLVIPVRVLPTALAATFSNPAPAANEPVTVTLPAGFRFSAEAGVSGDKGAGIVQSFSADSTSIVVVIPLGSSGPLTLDGVVGASLPGVTLDGVPTEAAIAADATPVPGTGGTATAPTVPVPALGGTTGFFDIGAFTAPDVTIDAGLGAQYYRLVITEAGDYTITTDWPGALTDIDAVQCPDTGCAGATTFVGTGSDHPEQGTLTLAPGTYYLAVVLFAGAPSDFSLRIDAVPTPPPAAP